MLAALGVLIRSFGLICSGHRAVALENMALRQQLAASSLDAPSSVRRSARATDCWRTLNVL